MRIGRGREIGRRARVLQSGGTENGRMKGNTVRGDPGFGRELHLEGETMAHASGGETIGGGTSVPGDR